MPKSCEECPEFNRCLGRLYVCPLKPVSEEDEILKGEEGGYSLKAILVIDEPNKCAECPVYDHTFWMCNRTGSKTRDINMDKLPDCPLKSLPQKKEIDENYKMKRWDDDCDYAHKCGYNCCFEDILHGEE